MTERIYIPLLDEGTNVWRPVEAQKVGPDTYLIPTGLDPKANGEEWEFPPGSTVVCQPRKTADGTILAAVRLADRGRKAI
jgi:hypothetical protein